MAVYRPKYRHPSTGELIEVANLVVRVLIRGEALSRIHQEHAQDADRRL